MRMCAYMDTHTTSSLSRSMLLPWVTFILASSSLITVPLSSANHSPPPHLVLRALKLNGKHQEAQKKQHLGPGSQAQHPAKPLTCPISFLFKLNIQESGPAASSVDMVSHVSLSLLEQTQGGPRTEGPEESWCGSLAASDSPSPKALGRGLVRALYLT